MKIEQQPNQQAEVDSCTTHVHTPGTAFLWPMVWFGGLLVLCYWPVLRQLVSNWMQDEDMGHAFFVPVVAGYIVWLKREQLLALPWRINGWGLMVVLLGGLQLIIATLGVELFLSRTALLVSLTGCLLYLGGWQVLHLLAFPLLLLLFMVPIPAILYNEITFPLQMFASRVAELGLTVVGIPVLREGNILELPSQRLSVVEACSGIRSLLTLSFMSLVYAHFFDEKRWMKPTLLVAVVPIAVIANAGRVMITGLFSEWNPELARGLFHSMEGWVIFMTALLLMVSAHQGINFVYGAFRKRNSSRPA
jgi:exosortase